MKMSFSLSVWKYALLTLSVVISMVGVILISVGVITLGGAGSPAGAYIVTILGTLVLALCCVGSFASLRESYVLSMVFVGVGAFTVICETIFMITFAAMKDDFMQMTKERVENAWEQEQLKSGAMFDIQIQYECCGMDSPQDYLKDDHDTLPSSCCQMGDCSDSNNIFSKGCDTMAINFIDSQSDNLILSLVGLVGLEVLAIVAAYYLAKTVQNRVLKSEQIIINE